MHSDSFSQRVLSWFDAHGRKDLPWKRQPTPYGVWISEMMLQQTQVITVIPYYERFMARFPNIKTLAVATLDEVLHIWSGLGYYARARHLHRAATIICTRYNGEIPLELKTLQSLPGIGRSTAGAILALAANQRQAILDGNVKRVLARFHAVEGWPGQSQVLATLWDLAEHHTPEQRVADYTQAMMDLGALVCTRHRPRCGFCPISDDCQAHRQHRETDFPAPRPLRDLPVRTTRMLMLYNQTGEVLLEKRPPTGLWGGLWSFPECSLETDIAVWCRNGLGVEIDRVQHWSKVRHSFSHFHLDIIPLKINVEGFSSRVMEGERFVWYNVHHPDERGLAAPVKRLLSTLANDF